MLKIRIKPILLLLACCLSGQYAWGDKPAGGEGNTPAQSALPPWQEGCLDIHLINTGATTPVPPTSCPTAPPCS